MKMILTAAMLMAVITTGLLNTGCEEEIAITSDRQARLVGNENLQLRKQLKARDQEVKNLTGQLDECREQVIAAAEGAEQFNTAIVEMLATESKKVETLTIENSQLKERIMQLEDQVR